MNLSKIHHIAIIVSDYEAAKDFYVNKLGFSVIRENYRPERKDWKMDLRVNEHTELEIFAEEKPPKRVNRPEACGLRHLAFCVESVEQTVKELAEVGTSCEPIRVDDYTDGGAEAAEVQQNQPSRAHRPEPGGIRKAGWRPNSRNPARAFRWWCIPRTATSWHICWKKATPSAAVDGWRQDRILLRQNRLVLSSSNP